MINDNQKKFVPPLAIYTEILFANPCTK